jgi:hypothetical protein
MTQTIINLGTGGAALNGQNGSTAGADSNDALFLDWPGDNAGNYVYLPNVAANFLSVPDEAALDITGDIDIRAYIEADDWTPPTSDAIVAKWTTSGNQRSYQLQVISAGTLRLLWSTDGTAETTATSTVATGIADGTSKWIRATLDVDNGASGYDVKFFLSDDGATWTQLGTTTTGGAVTSIFSGSANVEIGTFSGGSSGPFGGKFYRAQVYSDLTETNKVLDVDTSVITSGAATTFNALTGQTVTINRGTAGRKTVSVVSPVWLFGTDDYMEVADNDLLDFGATDSFTVLAVVRQWATPVNFGHWIAKRDTVSGWAIGSNGTLAQLLATVDDGPNTASSSGQPITVGALQSVGFIVNRVAQTINTYVGGSFSATASTTSVGSVGTPLPMRVGANGRAPATQFQDFELLAVAVFRRALTATEISQITAYYQSRLS